MVQVDQNWQPKLTAKISGQNWQSKLFPHAKNGLTTYLTVNIRSYYFLHNLYMNSLNILIVSGGYDMYECGSKITLVCVPFHYTKTKSGGS